MSVSVSQENTCLNKVLAEKVAASEEQVENQKKTSSGFIEEGTLMDPYANADDEISLKDRAYLPVSSSAAEAKLVEAFMHAQSVIEAAEWSKDKAVVNARDIMLLEPSAAQIGDAKKFVEHVKGANHFLRASRAFFSREP